ncbi:hypothetical protein WMF31_33655 [Sorangium sp. So ce1036]|uniref:hypothetical protein n=1 Tax=Sorangium sp. So ce1036 TaxID=3133328 RepID=UPI003F06339F
MLHPGVTCATRLGDNAQARTPRSLPTADLEALMTIGRVLRNGFGFPTTPFSVKWRPS